MSDRPAVPERPSVGAARPPPARTRSRRRCPSARRTARRFPPRASMRGKRRCVTEAERGPNSGGAQVTAEAMPYHRHRRPECNTGRPHPSSASSSVASARRRRRVAGPGAGPGRSPGRGATVAALRGTNLRRGIPGPSRPCHGHRSSRRPERRDRLRIDRGDEPARRGGPAPSARLPSAGQHLRRRGAAHRRGRGRPGPPAVGARRRLRRHRSISWSSIPTTTWTG